MRSTAPLLLLVPLLFLGGLGFDELWSPEGRWAVICRDMMERGEYTDAWEFERSYLDKPLVSYWAMIAIARLTGALDEFALRLPGALLGLACVVLAARIAFRAFGAEGARSAAWILASMVLFVHWGRIATTEIWNCFAILAGVAWYWERRERPGWVSSLVFSLVLAAGSLCKGPVSAAVTILIILPDLLAGGGWRAHAGWHWVPALAAGAVLYAAQFLVAGVDSASERFALMVKDNFTRFLHPWDHKSPPTIYLMYLPAYILPWSIFFPAILLRLWRKWRTLPAESRAMAWSALLVLLFFMASGSRRSYYILPAVPICALLVADYLRDQEPGSRVVRGACALAWTMILGMILWQCALKPLVLDESGGMRVLAREVRDEAGRRAPWEDWNVILIGTRPSAGFYLAPPGRRPERDLDPKVNIAELPAKLAARPRSIVVTIRRDRGFVEPFLTGWTVLDERDQSPAWIRAWVETEKHLVVYIP